MIGLRLALTIHSLNFFCKLTKIYRKITFIKSEVKLPKYRNNLNVHQQINGLRRRGIMEYYLAVKKNDVVPFATRWLDLEGIILSEGLLWWLRSKKSACNAGDLGFDSWIWKSPWKRKWQPTPIFLPGQRSLMDYSPWRNKSRTRFSN